jgi:hypothetical protein
MNKPVLLARIRVRANRLKADEGWHEISYGPRRLVRCNCGGCVEDLPQTGEYAGGACSHIVAFYAGDVTEDARQAGDGVETGFGRRLSGPWLVQLTKEGRELFSWRWAARKLASS